MDPTSDIGIVDEDDAPSCNVCGDPIVNSPTHRVRTWIDDDNQIQYRHFCDDDCLTAWDNNQA